MIPFEDLELDDVKCPRCSWTVLTGGMTEEAHAAVCGPIPGRRSGPPSFDDFVKKCELHGELDREREGSGPEFEIGACPIPRIGSVGPQIGSVGPSLSACKFFKFAFILEDDFGEDGVLKDLSLRNAMSQANVPRSINQPPKSVDETVESLANELAQKVRTSGTEESDTFEQFSGTFMVQVIKRE